jgi:hypothetical protein
MQLLAGFPAAPRVILGFRFEEIPLLGEKMNPFLTFATLASFVLFLCSSSAQATPCYGGISYGKATLSGISTEREDTFFSSSSIKTTTAVDGGSNPHEFFLGCALPWWNTAVELTYLDGLKASKHTTVTGAYGGSSVSTTVDQEATAKAYEISMLKFIDMSDSFKPFFRLGVLHAEGDYTISVPFQVNGQSYSIEHKDHKSKTGPFAGIGLEWRTKKLPFSVRIEENMYCRDLKATYVSVVFPL